jgi:insulin receptor
MKSPHFQNYYIISVAVCQSVDIRNRPANLIKLTGCRVVEGFVQILLMDNYQDEEFDTWTFPDLVEITDFLLLFRINGLKSLQKLFPNLSVIRGNTLFQNYALVIYEMMHLQVIEIIIILF